MGERKKMHSKFAYVKKLILPVSIFIVSVFIHPLSAHAASLFLPPSSGTYKVGQTFSVGVYVGSADQAMNAVEGVISFPKDILEVTGVSKSGSILNLWVQEPAFSNAGGTANFEGIVYNPGFNGKSGKIVTVTFKAKAQGSASVNFNSGSVLANDGAGTNILTGMGRAVFTVGEKTTEVSPTTPSPKPSSGPVPTAPKVTSLTHPDSTKWYSANNVSFDWALPGDVIGVSTLIDREVATDSGTKSSGKLNTIAYPDVQDGTWYFHVRLQNARGWGAQTNMQFNIDTAQPDTFIITELPRTTTTEKFARFYFTASDALSGIQGYQVAVDKDALTVWNDDGSHVYNTPALNPGFHVLVARVYDKAGNYLERTTSFEIAQGSVAPQQVVVQKIVQPEGFFISDMVILIGGLILFILIIILLILLIIYMWHKSRYLKKHLRETPESIEELEHSLAKIFAILRGKLEEYSLLVEKTRVKEQLAEHEISNEEHQILADFKHYLDSADRIMKNHFHK